MIVTLLQALYRAMCFKGAYDEFMNDREKLHILINLLKSADQR